MKSKCQYCDSYVAQEQERCPSCGGINPNYKRNSNGQPQTINDLKEWYRAHNLPPEDTTRFYIGKNVKQAKAFGIFKDSDNNFVVYKNKADGTRAERYRGNDEAFAVNEIYQKLKETIATQKSNPVNAQYKQNNNSANRNSANNTRNRNNSNYNSNYNNRNYSQTYSNNKSGSPLSKVRTYIAVITAMFLCYCCGRFVNSIPDNGYYRYMGKYYYNQNGDYYVYDSWEETWNYYDDDPPFTDESYKDYLIDKTYAEGYAYSDFTDSEYYTPPSSGSSYTYYDDDDDSWWGSSWDDDDDDWDSGWDTYDSWDSDWGSDWDSDW